MCFTCMYVCAQVYSARCELCGAVNSSQKAVGYFHMPCLAGCYCNLCGPQLGKIVHDFSSLGAYIAPFGTMKAIQQEGCFLLSSFLVSLRPMTEVYGVLCNWILLCGLVDN